MTACLYMGQAFLRLRAIDADCSPHPATWNGWAIRSMPTQESELPWTFPSTVAFRQASAWTTLLREALDAIRDELAALGVLVKDARQGTTWHVKSGV